MFVLRFTQDLMKDMKVSPTEHADTSELFSWHSHIYRLNNRKHIIFINDLSRLCVIIDGVRTAQIKQLKQKFLSTLEQYLLYEDIHQGLVNAYVSSKSEIIISKTNSRSVLATMKEITMHETDAHLDLKDNMERMKWLNRLIYKPIDYKEPIHVFKDAIQNQF
ncbi:DUF6933 domain-containing protein [Paenibacillus sp. GCM10023252]|uniref:DUF6933 domain-containing protein n=1 Tax=Paenibacillus sp. GCM10023252 TaxID=3252649 RepID=UPI00361B9748